MRSLTLLCLAFFAGTLGGCGNDGDSSVPAILLIAPNRIVVADAVTITGTSFGTTQGEVFVGATSAAITSWADGTIVFTMPDVLPGDHDVVVSNAVGDSAPAGVAVVLPAAVFVHDDDHLVYGFLVDGAGVLTPLAGSPYDTGGTSAGFGGDSDCVRVHVGTRRVFATNDASVAVWDIDPATGALTAVVGSPFAIAGASACYGVVVNAAGTLLFVADYDADAVHVLAIDALGALAPVAGSPFSDGGSTLDVPKLSPDGNYLYVNDETADPSSVHVFAVAVDGTLTPITNNPFDYPDANSYAFGLEMSPQGRLYVPDHGFGAIRVYDLAVDGTPTENAALATSQTEPNSLAFTRNGARLFANEYDTQIMHVYDVDVATGALTEVANSPFTIAAAVGLSPLVADDTGAFLFAGDESGAGLHVFAVDAAGTLTPVGGVIPLSGEPSGIDFAR
ncbi:MAG TPA: beta-propeller fold lactonase family protein [Planctomycetota bacterium]|nr:beta-propeller fold lactonase family protein [Planctomycetota bacterium]